MGAPLAGAAAAALGGGEAAAVGVEGAAWGTEEMADQVVEGDSISRHPMDVGNGNTLELDPDQLSEFLRSPEILSQLERYGQELVERANSMAVTEGAEYTYLVQANEGYELPQLFLHPANFAGKIDDAAHSTLLQVAATVDEDVPVEVGGDAEVWIPIASPGQEDYHLPANRTLWSKAAGR
jgi:hypothetical protein